MSPPRSARKPLKLLTEIRRDLAEVDKICIDWENGTNSEDEERVGALIECAFENSLVLMETIGRAETRNHVSALFDRARKNLTKSAYSVNASEVYSVWSWQLSNILNAVEKVDFGLAKDVEEPIDLIIRVLDRMGSVERALKTRHDSRPTLTVEDEYDIQDLLRSLLFLYFDDVSEEDPSPKFAGSSTRVDLLLRKERIVVEVKKTRPTMTEGELGQQLKLDIVDYKQRQGCDALIIVIDDRARRLKNPKGFVDDLTKVEEGFRV